MKFVGRTKSSSEVRGISFRIDYPSLGQLRWPSSPLGERNFLKPIRSFLFYKEKFDFSQVCENLAIY
jgi:hypothetical protein